MTPERVVIGDAELWCGDCREIVPTLAAHGALIADPPYGQKLNVNSGNIRNSINSAWRAKAVLQRNGGACVVRPNVWSPITGDDAPFDPAWLLGIAPVALLWGAHKFHERLPAGSWLVWDKVPTGKRRDQGDGEAAWINRAQPMRIFRLLWDGLCVGEGARHEVTAGQKRVHPTQKPEVLMRWCIEQCGTPASVLDPYMGSGSTGVACAQMGVAFTGIEIERRYFDIACERIARAQAQGKLFEHEPQPKPVQLEIE